MTPSDIDAFVNIVKQAIDQRADAIRSAADAEIAKLANTIAAQQSEIASMAAKLAAIPTPKDGADATPDMVAKAVADHMRAHPVPVPDAPAPLAPTLEQISESVKGYMAEHPIVAPEPLAPEFADIAKAVGEFIAANPIKVPDAPAALEPTPEQLAQAVQKHLLANPLPKGDPGLDAVEIDILPSINTERRYAKGTYARWGGGVIRASRDTDPGEPLASGWDVVMEGVKAIEVHALGGAEFAVKSMLTGGASHVAKMAAPTFAEAYKGVWKESAGEYQRGDMVTHKGSVWLAKEATTERPGAGDGWKLVVKSGRDGKDLNVVKIDRPDTYKLDGQK